jgi:hypothetical protein
MVPEVNQQAHDALIAAGEQLMAAAPNGGATEVSDEEATVLLRRRDDEAKRLLREKLAAEHGEANVFDTTQLSDVFEVIGFAAPLVVVRRLADNQKGSLFFTHEPRLYYGFQPDMR